MIHGVSGAPLPPNLPFGPEVMAACAGFRGGFPPCLVYAIKLCETGLSADPLELEYGADPVTWKMPDGRNCGVGPFQVTSAYPVDIKSANVQSQCEFALREFILPAWDFWIGKGMEGDDLVRCVAASYNAGEEQAWRWHVDCGSVDAYTTRDGNGVPYGKRALDYYHQLIRGECP